MSETVTVKIADQSIEVNVEALSAYKDEAFGHLDAIAGAKDSFKEMLEGAAEATGLPKKIISKYLKDKHAEKTKEASEVGKVFETLDEALA
jgi:hypothetical protein